MPSLVRVDTWVAYGPSEGVARLWRPLAPCKSSPSLQGPYPKPTCASSRQQLESRSL